MLKIFKAYRHGTSILDDFDFYEEKENTRCARKGINADSLHEARLSYFGTDDLKSMVYIVQLLLLSCSYTFSDHAPFPCAGGHRGKHGEYESP